MGKDIDRDHFDDYRKQNQVKHEILEAYLSPYFKIVGKGNSNLLYLDGFAGRGTYTKESTGEVFDGSPLRALKLIAENETFARKVSTFFIEDDKKHYDLLEKAVNAFSTANKKIPAPKTYHGKFADGVSQLLQAVGGKLVPTFLFVDPCGVAGTSFQTIKSVMASKSSEAFIFFNISAVRRIAGLPGDVSKTLVELLGSERRAEDLFKSLQKTGNVSDRERMILESYRKALREDMGVTYSIPFRVESEDKQATSHYLIHASNHSLGFTIMKDIMWKRGQSEESQGALEFVQASRTDYIPMFDRRYDAKLEIKKALADGPKCVDLFYKKWVCRPHDLTSQSAYRQDLLELEAHGEIEVLDKDGLTPKNAANRRAPKGKATLGEGYYVRLVK